MSILTGRDGGSVLSRVNAVLVFVVLALAVTPAIYSLQAIEAVRADLPKSTFYHARDLHLAIAEVNGLARTLQAVRWMRAAPAAVAEISDAADLLYVRFDAYRRAYQTEGGGAALADLEAVDTLQRALDATVAAGSPIALDRFDELADDTDALIRQLRRHLRAAEADTDNALKRGMATVQQLRFEIYGSILVLTLLSGIVLVLATQYHRSGLQIHHALRRDGLTGLANRRGFNDWLRHHGAEVGYSETFVFAVIDIDDFRRTNSRLGNDAGDRVLKGMADWLAYRVGAQGVVVRWGGDEFAVALPVGSGSVEGCVAWLDGVMANAPTVQVGPERIQVTVSGGAAVWPTDSEAVADVTRFADLALVEARDRGRRRIVIYEPKLSERRSRIAHLRLGMERALRSSEFTLHWQPQVRLRDGRVVAAEALLRWTDPVTGERVSPGEFIPVAEASDLIIAIDRWVLDEACRIGASWVAMGEVERRIAVNVSPRHFRSGGLVQTVREVLTRHRLPSRLLELEITEGVLLVDNPTVAENLAGLADLGVRLALDDFGTGYSNIAYLTRLKPDVLKIDRSFLEETDAHLRSNIVKSILRLAEALGAETLTEGLSNEADLAFLADAGCEMAQGFLFAPAMPPREFLAWCREFEQRSHGCMERAGRPHLAAG